MKTFFITFILCSCYIIRSTAQNDYIVTTSPVQEVSLNEEDQFIRNSFPLQILCKWTPGMKFMFVPSGRQFFLPILCNYDEEKEIDNNLLKYKILTFTGTEEKTQEISRGIIYSTRFIFECEGKKYYHEMKDRRLDEICEKNPRACINGLVYLKDVDLAKELLVGRKVYIQAGYARIDDANNYAGYQEINIPANTEAIITAVGVGNQAYPVKIVFTDSQDKSFYLEVALSRTNSGMDMSDFQAEKRMKYFSNAISFASKKNNDTKSLKDKYINATVYPRNLIAVQKQSNSSQVRIPRYTTLLIKDVRLTDKGSLANLLLEDKDGELYETEVDLKYNIIVKNNNFIEDIFAFGDMRKRYPGISEARWDLIANGKVENGMNTEECRLSLGNPIEIRVKNDTRFETWLYTGRTLDFESGHLQRFQ